MKGFSIFLFLFISFISNAQQRFTLRLEPSSLTAVPAVHSGAFGSYEHKWFFIGGRTNGLHGFQPPFAFPVSGINDSIFIVDASTNQSWSASTYTLPDSIREAITSSNMEFYLNDSMLYMIGGYGWKDAIQDFITLPTLTAINIKGLMNAVISVQPITSYFRQIVDTNILAVCGAHLDKLDSTYYLVFGHRFDGTYNRSDTAGFFVQHYTYAIRKFQIADNGTNLSIYNYRAVLDSNNFRRRDYNLIPFIDPYRGKGLLAFGGVFQPNANLPYLTPIEIYPDTVIVRNDFNQNLSQYHCAVCALYDSATYLQHNIFFGGLSMYYMDTLTQQTVYDSLIPFVRTISDVARDIDFNYHEINAGIRMPALLGTNAYFFYDDSVPMFYKNFVDLNHLKHHQRIGFITGGIESPDLNIGLTGSEASFASPRVFEVYVDTIADTTVNITEINNDVLNFFCYPNPAKEQAEIVFEIKKPEAVKMEMIDAKGSLVKEICNQTFNAGKQKLLLNLSSYPKGVYNCVISVNNHLKSIRLAKE